MVGYGLTIHSSRRRFAARLNSGVRLHMRYLAIAIILYCAACSKVKTDLEAAFATEQPPGGQVADARSVSVTGLERGDFTTFRSGSDVNLLSNSIRVDFPGWKPLLIPAADVQGCTMVCFGGEKWNVDLLIPRTEASLSFEHSKAVYEWCWANRRPMISGAATRDWLYNGKPLPASNEFASSLESRVAYDNHAKSACNGY